MDGRAVTPLAVVAPSSQAVVEYVAAHPDAIGYVSMGVVGPEVKVLKIEGELPTSATVSRASYPLSRELWLVRDRLGVKPLFYLHRPERLLFASEIKAILCDPSVERRVDLTALHHFLSLNYTPAPYTLFEGIRQLLPGHYLLVEADGRVEPPEPRVPPRLVVS